MASLLTVDEVERHVEEVRRLAGEGVLIVHEGGVFATDPSSPSAATREALLSSLRRASGEESEEEEWVVVVSPPSSPTAPPPRP